MNLERKEAANRGAPGAGVIEDPDDDLHRIIRLECARVKPPKKVVLMRWLGCELCVNIMIGARDAHVRYFKWEAEIKATDSRDVNKSKAIFLRDQLVDNEAFVWFYFFGGLNSDTHPNERAFSGQHSSAPSALRKSTGR